MASLIDRTFTSFPCINLYIAQVEHRVCNGLCKYAGPSDLQKQCRSKKWRVNITMKTLNEQQPLVDKSISVERSTSDRIKSKHSCNLGYTNISLSANVRPSLFSKMTDVPMNIIIAIGALFIVVAILVRRRMVSLSEANVHGSVSDLVKRGQLRSDRRKISQLLRYDDPFNNPLVRVNEKSLTMKMCGKVFRLAPVTLTEDQVVNHQKRRMRAYQWKRPTLFLKEGDSIPPGIDPDTVRWVPVNHPFATAGSDIDESLAQRNVYQKRGAPSRIRAEHEKLQQSMMMKSCEEDDFLAHMSEFAGTGRKLGEKSLSEKPSNIENSNSYQNGSQGSNRDEESSGSQTSDKT